MDFSGVVGWYAVLVPLSFSNVNKLYSNNNSNNNDLPFPFHPVSSRGITSSNADKNRKEKRGSHSEKKKIEAYMSHISFFFFKKKEN